MSIATATLRGSGRTNQDTAVVTDHAMAVLDGATSWLPQETGRDGGWYSRMLGARLAQGLDSDTPLVELLAEAIAGVCGDFGLVPGNAPESTVTIARWTAEEIEILVLCDSPAVIYQRGLDPIVILDDRLQTTGASARAAYHEHLRAGGGYGRELDRLLGQLQRDELALQNRPGGYWSASATPEAAEHALTERYSLRDVEHLILLTDGASAAVDDYRRPADWSAALEDIRRAGPGQFLESVHILEETDPNGFRWPRAKRHDDKALALLHPLVTSAAVR